MLTSHYMDDIKELCDRVIIINFGKIIYDGKVFKRFSKPPCLSIFLDPLFIHSHLSIIYQKISYNSNSFNANRQLLIANR